MLKTWRARRRCFHHNNHTGESWIGRGSIVDWRKWYQCSRCGKGWTFDDQHSDVVGQFIYCPDCQAKRTTPAPAGSRTADDGGRQP